MTSRGVTSSIDRVAERRRAVALAHHFREAEGLSIAQIAARLGRSPATVKAYFYDPTGDKARAVKARYVGVCRGCGAYTQPRNGKGDAYAYCKQCHPGVIQRRWTRELVISAVREWQDHYGRLLRLVAHARRRREHAVLAGWRTLASGQCSQRRVGKLGPSLVRRPRTRLASAKNVRVSPTIVVPKEVTDVRALPDEPRGAVAAAD
jgi:AraC-like DNA-binding protein